MIRKKKSKSPKRYKSSDQRPKSPTRQKYKSPLKYYNTGVVSTIENFNFFPSISSRSRLVLADRLYIGTLSDLVYQFLYPEITCLHSVATEKNKIVNLKPYSNGYIFASDNVTNVMEYPAQIFASKLKTGMRGTYWDGNFNWSDLGNQLHISFKKQIIQIFKLNTPVSYFDVEKGFVDDNNFPLVFYFVQKPINLKLKFINFTQFNNIKIWSIVDEKQTIIGKAVYIPVLFKIIEHPGILLFSQLNLLNKIKIDCELKKCIAFGNFEINEKTVFYDDIVDINNVFNGKAVTHMLTD
jgi:hypothetical protein